MFDIIINAVIIYLLGCGLLAVINVKLVDEIIADTHWVQQFNPKVVHLAASAMSWLGVLIITCMAIKQRIRLFFMHRNGAVARQINEKTCAELNARFGKFYFVEGGQLYKQDKAPIPDDEQAG